MKDKIMTRDQLVSWLYENGFKYSDAIKSSMTTLTVLLNREGASNRIHKSTLLQEWKCTDRWVRDKLRIMRLEGLIDYETEYPGEFTSYKFFRLGPYQP